MKTVLALIAAVALTGCGAMKQRELQARIDELRAQSQAAAQECDITLPVGNSKTAMARAKCQTEAMLITRPVAPFPDIVDH
jgi:hypothetical protein